MNLRSEAIWTEQLELTQVPEGFWPGVYLLGVPSSRITFADQQKRAFNLVASLVASRRLRAGASVACVGGGIAGITAAAYAAQLGLVVTVYEQHSDAMMLQQGSGRWIHPNLYDWPWKHWSTPHTAFPCMNWRAGMCAQVVATLREEWRQLVAVGKVGWNPKTLVSSMTRSGDRWILNRDDGLAFDAIILAVGFGEDGVREDLGCKPYWRDDDLHQRVQGAAHVLVSGCGDGGLIDALRALMLDFRHEGLLRFCELAAKSSLADSVRSIEVERPRYPDGVELEKAYLALDAPPELELELQAALKPDVRVTLNGASASPFDRGSSAVNRFLVSRFLRNGRVDYLRGRIDPNSIERRGSLFTVKVDAQSHDFDHVVLRHGPRPPAIDRFAEVAGTIQPARAFFRTYRDVADRTRQDLWNFILADVAGVSASPEPAQPPLDPHLLAYLADQAHSILKLELGALLPGTIVKRLTEGQVVKLVADDGARPIGVVQTTFESATRVVMVIALSGDSPTLPAEVLTGDNGDLLLAEMKRVIRNAAFLMAGKT